MNKLGLQPLRIHWIGLLVLGTIGLIGCAAGVVEPPDIEDTWKPPEGSEAAPPLSCEEIGSLFTYDAQAPLDVQEINRSREEGVTVIDLTYASPMGGRVPATLVLPDGPGPFAGLVYQHGMPSTRQPMIPGAVIYARMGAVVVLIDAPFARRVDGMDQPITMTAQDRREQIQLIIDLRRAIDLLLSRSEVDPQRLAYVGISYGGAMGGLLAGVEDRLQGYVLQVGDGGLVTHLTGPEDRENWLAEPEQVRRWWVSWMWPIEPVHYVGCAAPAVLLFQNGTFDTMVPPADALRYQQAGSEPKTVRWYKSGHGLGLAALRDQAEWLSQTIAIHSRMSIPRGVRFSLYTWFILALGSLLILVWLLWRVRPAPYEARLMWLLTTVFLGPLGLLAYWITSHESRDAGVSAARRSSARRALGSASWAAAGNLLGGIGVLALLLYLPGVFSANLALEIAVTFLLPFCIGWLVFSASRWLSRGAVGYPLDYRRPFVLEMVSTCLVLVGVYPVVYILIDVWLERWTAPFGFDLSYPPLWGVLCLGAIAGTLVAYPFHLWMLRRGLFRWSTTIPHEKTDVMGLAWYLQAVLVALSFAAMLGGMFLAMQVSGG